MSVRVVIVGGSGTVGRAIARRMVETGCDVVLAGRHQSHVPRDLEALQFVEMDRCNRNPFSGLTGGDLLVDATCYTAQHARDLIPLLPAFGSAVVISTKAVYVDSAGRHVNSDDPPDFTEPIDETNPTVEPDYSDNYNTRAGYAACKVAAEQILLDSGYPVTVLRASKVHGDGPARSREWILIRHAQDGRRRLSLAHRGESGDHPTAAANLASLVDTVAGTPGRRILNAADPDTPTALQLVRAVEQQLDHQWDVDLLDHSADRRLGDHPWNIWPPLRLDMSAAAAIGWRPAGTYAQTIGATLRRLRTHSLPPLPPDVLLDRESDATE